MFRFYFGSKAVSQQNSTLNGITAKGQVVATPGAGKYYHGVFPGGEFAEEDQIKKEELASYQEAVGKKAVWVYFTHNWFKGKPFPVKTASWIRDNGSVPFIRLMLRSSEEQNVKEPKYTLARIIRGDFDKDLRAWARGAKTFGTPLLAEFGTEVNGEWFAWNGKWNGGGAKLGYGDKKQFDGPERFKDAYRRIIRLSREEGASNILWAFHINSDDVPNTAWNKFENYYPGDKWIDWLGVSIYGAGTPMAEAETMREMMDAVYPRLAKLSKTKPVVILELGFTNGHPAVKQEDWAKDALTELFFGRWPRVIGFAWWNESWENDDDPAHNSVLRVQNNPALAAVFKKMLGENENVLGEPFYRSLIKKVNENIKPETSTKNPKPAPAS